jgi:hypothetical protein
VPDFSGSQDSPHRQQTLSAGRVLIADTNLILATSTHRRFLARCAALDAPTLPATSTTGLLDDVLHANATDPQALPSRRMQLILDQQS